MLVKGSYGAVYESHNKDLQLRKLMLYHLKEEKKKSN